MSVFGNAIQALLQHETGAAPETAQPIAALYISPDPSRDIESIEILREQAETILTGYFTDEDAFLYGIAITPCPQVPNPADSLLIAIYLADNEAGDSYNNRASALLEENISGNFLLFELDAESRRFTSNSDTLRTTVAVLCDEARQDTMWGSFSRSLGILFSKTTIGKYFEGFASVGDSDEY